MSDATPAITHFFSISVDSVDLGHWTKMSGIGMSIATTDRADSAMTFFQHHLPGGLQYSQITLERPVGDESGVVMAWINAYHLLPVPTAGQIVCLDQTGSPLMMWEMIGVSPVSWKGPSFDAASGPNVGMESLTLAHMGFL